MLKYEGKRGEFYLYSEGNGGEIIYVYLGQKDDPKSDYILSVHRFYIDSLIAVLNLAKQKV